MSLSVGRRVSLTDIRVAWIPGWYTSSVLLNAGLRHTTSIPARQDWESEKIKMAMTHLALQSLVFVPP